MSNIIAVGDLVYSGSNHVTEWEVLAIDEPQAWIKNRAGGREVVSYCGLTKIPDMITIRIPRRTAVFYSHLISFPLARQPYMDIIEASKKALDNADGWE